MITTAPAKRLNPRGVKTAEIVHARRVGKSTKRKVPTKYAVFVNDHQVSRAGEGPLWFASIDRAAEFLAGFSMVNFTVLNCRRRLGSPTNIQSRAQARAI